MSDKAMKHNVADFDQSVIDKLVESARQILDNRKTTRKNKHEKKYGKHSKHAGSKTGKHGGTKVDRKLKAKRKFAEASRKRNYRS